VSTAVQEPLVTPERWHELMAAPADNRPVTTWTHDLTAAIRDGRCFQCGAPNASPREGSNVPYCARCKREQAARMERAQRAHPERF